MGSQRDTSMAKSDKDELNSSERDDGCVVAETDRVNDGGTKTGSDLQATDAGHEDSGEDDKLSSTTPLNSNGLLVASAVMKAKNENETEETKTKDNATTSDNEKTATTKESPTPMIPLASLATTTSEPIVHATTWEPSEELVVDATPIDESNDLMAQSAAPATSQNDTDEASRWNRIERGGSRDPVAEASNEATSTAKRAHEQMSSARPELQRMNISEIALRVHMDEESGYLSTSDIEKHTTNSNKKSASESKPSWWKNRHERNCILGILATIVIGAIVILLGIVYSRKDGGEAANDKGTGGELPNGTSPPSDILNRSLSWSIGEFGMPHVGDGNTWPWSEYKTIEECFEYCEAISGGTYIALAYRADMRIPEAGIQDTLRPIFPRNDSIPDCYCFSRFTCNWDDDSFLYNGTIVSAVQRPEKCDIGSILDDESTSEFSEIDDEDNQDGGLISETGDSVELIRPPRGEESGAEVTDESFVGEGGKPFPPENEGDFKGEDETDSVEPVVRPFPEGDSQTEGDGGDGVFAGGTVDKPEIGVVEPAVRPFPIEPSP